MRIISSDGIDKALTFSGLVETLRTAFRGGAVQPVRHHHAIKRLGASDATLLLMPAWTDFSANPKSNGYIGVKIVTVAPDNNAAGLPAVMGQYLLLDGRTGEPLALIDGQRLTQWRTACASALASSYLSREDSEHLLVIGAGAMAPFLARAHAAVRPIRRVSIWNRTPDKATALAGDLVRFGLDARYTPDLAEAAGAADIISSATIASEPLVKGKWLKPGVHVDLVGAFTPTMRESDDEAVRRSKVFVDTRDGASKEAGDVVQAMASGALAPNGIVADLYELTRDTHRGREDPRQITLFKSVGAALEDMAAGVAVFEAGSAGG